MATDTHKETSLVGLFTGVYNYLKGLKFLDTVLPKQKSSVKPNDTKEKSKETNVGLFPKKIVIDNETLKDSSAVACSTNEPSKLVKVENLDGSISWSFAHDHNNISFSTLTSPFLTSTGSTTPGGFSPMVNMNMFTGHKDSPSPLTMDHHHGKLLSTNNNSDIDSANSLDEDLAKIPDLPNPEFFNIGGRVEEGEDDEEVEESEDDSDASIDQKTGKKKTKSYICEFCGAEFRIRGYLTRHVKKHALNKAYECPFFDDHAESKCHPNGGFSRRDTYKTHLKARHFKYPPGTRSQDRAITPGKCGLCNKPYESNEDWVEKHIEGGQCEALPKGYTGRVKNSRRKNYEYPNPQQISPISSNSGNDSPMTSKSSPQNLILPQHQHDTILNQDSLANLTPGSMGTPVNHALNSRSSSTDNQILPIKYNGAVQFSEYNDYDNNDEFSLDVEQCMPFTPMVHEYTY